MNFSQQFLDELRGRLTLSEIVGRRVALKRKGPEASGLCPFHNEKTASFTVNDRKGFFHCFGCGAHGDVVGFVMRSEGLSFPETVERLAGEAGLALPTSSPQERERSEQRDTLMRAIEVAARWFERQLRLPQGRAALDYLHGRGLDDAAIERFRLGFAPDNREALIAALKREGLSLDTIVQAGLAIQPEDAREPYDRFRGRAMFPIADRRGRLIAFGGRILGDGEPKYLNSPETPLFHKGANLYCLDRAREAAYAGKPVIVSEGYMDAIALHLAGFTGAVAPLGTALTEEQLALLWKVTDEPILCFDGDNAGRRAAFRAAERALPVLSPGKSLRFVSLPSGEDPDSLIRGQGKGAMQSLLEAARPLADIVWELETAGQPLDTPERRAKVRAALRRRAGEIRDETVRELYREALEARAQEQFFRRPAAPGWRPRVPTGRPGQSPSAFNEGSAVRQSGHNLGASRRERLLLGLPILRPDLLGDLVDPISQLELSGTEFDRLRAAVLAFAASMHEDDDPALAAAVTLDRQALNAFLEKQGLAAIAAIASGEAARWLDQAVHWRQAGMDDSPEKILERWHLEVEVQMTGVGGSIELRRAEEAWMSDPTSENMERLKAIKEQILPSRASR